MTVFEQLKQEIEASVEEQTQQFEERRSEIKAKLEARTSSNYYSHGFQERREEIEAHNLPSVDEYSEWESYKSALTTRYLPALNRAIENGQTEDALAIISEYGGYFEDEDEVWQDGNHYRTLKLAVYARNTEVAQAIVQSMEDDYLFYHAVEDGDLEVVQALISAGADVNTSDPEGFTPLQTASKLGHIAIVQALISAGADDYRLHYAVEDGDLKTVQALISAGADVNASDPEGFTPLQTASEWGHTAIAQALISAGAN